MALSLTSTITALGPNLTSSFLASGGSGAITYSLRANGAGGSINSTSGLYTAPASVNESQPYDTIVATDNTGAYVTSQIFVSYPIGLFCDIIQTGMGLPPGRVIEWNQKAFLPTDPNLWIAVSVPIVKPISNMISYDGSGSGINADQSVTCLATLDIDIMSRGPAARDQKEQVLLALLSNYSEQQQEINSFQISRISNNFVNLSQIDGAAIPFRFRISCRMTYSYAAPAQAVGYYSSFPTPVIYTNP